MSKVNQKMLEPTVQSIVDNIFKTAPTTYVVINPGTLAVNGPAQASYELSVNGDIYASGGVVAAAVTSSGVINNGNINLTI